MPAISATRGPTVRWRFIDTPREWGRRLACRLAVWRALAFFLRLLLLGLPQGFLFGGVALCQCLRLRLMLLFERLHIGACGGLLCSLLVISGLLLLQLLPLFLLAVMQGILLLLVDPIA